MRRNKLPKLGLSSTTRTETASNILSTLIIILTIPVVMLIVNIVENTSINQNTSSTPTPSSSGNNAFEKSEPVSNFSSYINKILSSAFSFISK